MGKETQERCPSPPKAHMKYRNTCFLDSPPTHKHVSYIMLPLAFVHSCNTRLKLNILIWGGGGDATVINNNTDHFIGGGVLDSVNDVMQGFNT